MKLVAGLGNPGSAYKQTRHNIGFMLIEYLAAAHKIKLNRTEYNVAWGKGEIAQCPITLACPQSYMNLSGQPVVNLLNALKVTASDLLVVCDDFNLLLGKMRLRPQGSNGGHNGLKSISNSLHTREYARLRIGIGPPDLNKDSADFVLAPFKSNEWPIVKEVIEHAAQAVELYLTSGIEAAMNRYN
ncbi:MAG: aminoacyl-tRNA hydrolase [Candidatus Schekmanbacteria bacterium]|nr:aminoacyl-tRNA hydrolase [Candidatus Schekmanbacteria bacterium]